MTMIIAPCEIRFAKLKADRNVDPLSDGEDEDQRDEPEGRGQRAELAAAHAHDVVAPGVAEGAFGPGDLGTLFGRDGAHATSPVCCGWSPRLPLRPAVMSSTTWPCDTSELFTCAAIWPR